MNTVYQEAQYTPTKRVTTRRETPTPSPRHQQHVMAPARLATRQALAVGVFGGLSLSALLTLAGRRYGVGLEAVDYGLLFVCLVSLGLMLGAWWGRATLAEMIAAFEPTEWEETHTEEAPPPQLAVDTFPYTNGGETRHISRATSVTVAGQMVTMKQIHAIRQQAYKDGTITRGNINGADENNKLSGEAYQTMTAALKAHGSLEDNGRGYRWTRAGLAWLFGPLPQDVSGFDASSPLDDDDDDGDDQ